MRIVLQHVLHQQRQSAKTFAHIRLAARKPHPDTRRNRDHRASSAAITCRKASVLTVPLTRSLVPLVSSISIEPASCATGAGTDVGSEGKLPKNFTAGAAAIRTGTKPSTCPRLPVSPASLRQRNSKLLAITCRRATADTDAVIVSSKARCRSSSDDRRLVSTTIILSLESF